jgi:nicotinate-nucleotide adenylyltransferase
MNSMGERAVSRPAALAVFGGTFDPVHVGHLRVAWEAAELLNAEVRLLPAGTPPHRPPPVASPAERAAMLEVALAGQPRLVLDAREIARPGPSYTYDTLCELRREWPAPRPLILLLGADAYAGLPSWHRWRELFDLAHVVILARPMHHPPLPADLAAETIARRTTDVAVLQRSPAGRVFELAVTPLEISASALRALLAAGRDPRWLVPDPLLRSGLLEVYRRAAHAG